MGKGIAIGFLAGALVAGVLFRLLAGDRGGPGEGAGGEVAAGREASPRVPGDGAAELAAARAEAETLRGRVRELEAKLEEARRAAAAGGARPTRDRVAKMRELAEAIARAKRESDATGQPMKNDKWLGPLLVLAGDFADQMGIPVQEAVLSPEWYPALAMALLDQSPFPLSEDQKAGAGRVVAAAQEAWDKYLAEREGLSTLERAAALRTLQFDMLQGMAGLGTPEQTNWFGSLNLPPPQPPLGPVWNGAGPRDACRANIEKNWAKALALQPAQVTSLGPVLDDYMRGYDAITAEAARRRKAGEAYDDVSAKIALMLATQKRVGETVRLTDEQARALREWNAVYDYQVKE